MKKNKFSYEIILIDDVAMIPEKEIERLNSKIKILKVLSLDEIMENQLKLNIGF